RSAPASGAVTQGPTMNAEENPRTATDFLDISSFPVFAAIQLTQPAGSCGSKKPNIASASRIKTIEMAPVVNGDCKTICRFWPDQPATAPSSEKADAKERT